MDKKEADRQRWLQRVHSIDMRLYANQRVFDIAKQQSRLEREADKILQGAKNDRRMEITKKN